MNQRLEALHRRGLVARRPMPRVRSGLWIWTRTTADILADFPAE